MRDDQAYSRASQRWADLRLVDLRRSTNDRKIMGVCGGIAEWLGVAPLAVRLVTFGSFFVVGPITIAAYVLLAILVDKDGAEKRVSPKASGAWGDGRAYASTGKFSREDNVDPMGGPGAPRVAESMPRLLRRFNMIEERLRKAEAEVTSTGFRINSELKRS
jgi:phage shock protein C